MQEVEPVQEEEEELAAYSEVGPSFIFSSYFYTWSCSFKFFILSGELFKPLGGRLLLLLLHEGSEKETSTKTTQIWGEEAKKEDFWVTKEPAVVQLIIVFTL